MVAHAWKRLVGLLVMAPVVGCAVTRGDRSEQAHSPEPGATAEVARELPPKRAAQACLATAAEFAKKGYTDDAIRQYEKARELDPKLTEIARRLAVLYHRQGDLTRASAEYKLALDAAPRDADLLNDIGYFCYDRGEWAEAETWLRKAVAANPKHRRAWVNLGMALAQQVKAKESYEAFAKAVSPAEAHSNVGMILAQAGHIDEAKTAMRRSLELEADSRVPRAALAELEKYRPTPDHRVSSAARLSAN